MIASPSAFMHVQSNAASGGSIATIWSAWYPLAPAEALDLGHGLSASPHRMPEGIEPLTHPLIVLAMIAVPLALAWWRGSFRLDGQRAMALLALLVVLRCALDPVNNFYYHEPLLLALLGWDALSSDRLPLRGVAAIAVAWGFDNWSSHLGDVNLFNAFYLLTMAVTAALLATALFKRQPKGAGDRFTSLMGSLGGLPSIRNSQSTS